MKKLVRILVLCGLMLLALSVTVSAGTEGYYTFSVSEEKATIERTDGRLKGDIKIPSYLGGYPVVAIGFDAFSDNNTITSVEIPNTVNIIEEYAFRRCKSLQRVVLGDDVSRIQASAFGYCTKLTTVIMGNKVNNIGRYAFAGCSNLKNVYYAGDETEWNSIDFTEGNALLIKRPKINYLQKKIEVDFGEYDDTSTFVVSYNNKGEMLNLQSKTVKKTQQETIAVDAETQKYKIIYWESLANLKPVYAPIEKEL